MCISLLYWLFSPLSAFPQKQGNSFCAVVGAAALSNLQAGLPPLYFHLPFYWMQLSSWKVLITPLYLPGHCLLGLSSVIWDENMYFFVLVLTLYIRHYLTTKKKVKKRGILNHHIFQEPISTQKLIVMELQKTEFN